MPKVIFFDCSQTFLDVRLDKENEKVDQQHRDGTHLPKKQNPLQCWATFYNDMFRFLLVSFAILGTLFVTPTFGIKEATVSISLHENEEAEKFLRRSETKIIGYIDLEASGGKIDVERISLGFTGTASSDDIRRAKLYTKWGTFLSSASILDDGMSFSNMSDVSLEDGEKQTLLLEIEVSSTAKIGKTIGFKVVGKESVHVQSQKYDIKSVALGSSLRISPFMISNAADTLVSVSAVSEPEYKVAMQKGQKAVFGTFRLEAFGSSEADITEITFRKTGTLPDSKIKSIVLADKNGEIIAENPVFQEQKITFVNPFSVAKNSSRDFDVVITLADSAKTGNNLFLEITSKWSIAAKKSEDESEVFVAGDFPLRSNTKTVTESGANIKLSSGNPVSRQIFPGEKNALLLEFTLQSATESIDFSSLTLDLFGDGSALIHNIRLKKNGEKSYISSIQSANTAIFYNIGHQDSGEKVVYQVLADISANTEEERFFGIKISSASDIKITAQNGKEVLVSGAFPLTGNTVTASGSLSKNTVEIKLAPAMNQISEQMPDAALGSISFFAKQENAEVQKITLEILGSADTNMFSNFRLMDAFGNAVSLGILSGETLTFSHPFGIRKGVSEKFVIAADVLNGDSEKGAVGMGMKTPAIVRGLESGSILSTIGNFPLSFSPVDIENIPNSAFVGYSARFFPARIVSRNEKDVKWGEIEFSAHNSEARIDRVLLIEGGNIGDGLTNVRLIDNKDGRLYPAKIADSSYIFEEPIRLEKNENRSFSLITDIRSTAPLGATFSYQISDSEQIRAKANGKDIPVIGHLPKNGSIFQVSEITVSCSREMKPVCGRKYQTCDLLPCSLIDKEYDNICQLKQDGAFFRNEGSCSLISNPEEISDFYFGKDETEKIISYDNRKTPDSFSDVPTTHKNADAIEFLRSAGIVQGFADGLFRAESEISRSAFIKIVIGAQFSETEIMKCLSRNTRENEQTAFFPDVPIHEWFASYICVAKTNGIIKGFPDGLFHPEKPVSFAEAAKIIGIIFGAKEETHVAWYAPFIEFLAEKKAIPDTVSSPEKNITRGEMAEMMYRLRE